MTVSIKKIYLYLVSLVSLVILVFGSIWLLNIGLKTWVFTKADKDYYYTPECIARTAPDGSSIACTGEEKAEAAQRAEDNRQAQKQREASNAVATILISAPVFFFHWRLAKKEV